MSENTTCGIKEMRSQALQPPVTQVPQEVLSSPALLFLYYRIEQILGIKPVYEALKNLNELIEETCGSTFIENPALYEYFITSREEIFNISKYFTVNETYFFRESVHFNILENIISGLCKSNRQIRICCAACSIGCEPYSIAMFLEHLAEKGVKLDYTIDAFDVNIEAIETAKNARYTLNALRNSETYWKNILDLYLTPDNGEFIVSPNIRRKVEFFPHNIINPLNKNYDIIFFRNALIYFSSRNRNDVLNNLTSSLSANGHLFFGISETSSVDHPALVSRYSSNAFYFQKTEGQNNLRQANTFQKTFDFYEEKDISIYKEKKHKPKNAAQLNSANRSPEQIQIHVDCAEINKILEIEEGMTTAQNVLELVLKNNTASLSGSSLAASVVYFLNAHDLKNADVILSFLEKQNSETITSFLRGEYYFLSENNSEAEKYYQKASLKNNFFWPAFYRIAVLASQGDQVTYKYKINKTMEIIKRSQNHQDNYECFLGGFSRDYFLRILDKKLA